MPNPDDVRLKLQGVFRAVFDAPALELTPAMTAKDVKDWDSITNIQLIVAVEKAFGVAFTTKEVLGLKNVGEFIALIRSRLGA